MAVQGFVRLRKHQFGKQTSFSSNASATRALPYRGAIVYDPQRELPDVDTGSIDPILAFFNGAGLMVLLGAEFIAMLLVIVYVLSLIHI